MISAELKKPSISARVLAAGLTYEEYHATSMEIGDVDPSYQMLRYVCQRFELNTEQRYWLAFLYATCYCGATTYYIYNEFPDFENVDYGRLNRWWQEKRSALVFQTDRARIRSNNLFPLVFKSYRDLVGGLKQEQLFNTFKTPDRYLNYENAFSTMQNIYQFGRFSMFLYLEATHVVTDYPMRPRSMDIWKADSCREGLLYYLGLHEDRYRGENRKHWVQSQFDGLVKKLEAKDPRNSVWNIETTLCAYKKYMYGQRWPGYYLDRQAEEISKMQKNVPEGVDWSVLWDYRKETYNKQYLSEFR